MTSKESLFAILNAVGGLMFLAVLVTVCLAMAAAPVAVFIWLVYLMLKFLGVFTRMTLPSGAPFGPGTSLTAKMSVF